MAPSALELPAGCAFRARCAYATEVCAAAPETRPIGAIGQAARCHHPLHPEASP
jgi:peptide/nickel transport system ATP-binding protein